MMRANVAATRQVRGLLWRYLPIADLTLGHADDHAGVVFAAIHRVLADPYRRLPDGRSLVELAPSRAEPARFDGHVRALCGLWTERAADLGLLDTLTPLACRGAVSCWRRVVGKFILGVRIDTASRRTIPTPPLSARHSQSGTTPDSGVQDAMTTTISHPECRPSRPLSFGSEVAAAATAMVELAGSR